MVISVEANQEGFTQTDAKSLVIESVEMENIVSEAMEGASLEDVKPESVAESLSPLLAGAEAYSYTNGYSRRSPSSYVNKQLLKIFTIIIKKLVKKIISNPRTRAKLQAAARQGSTAVARLITPSVVQVLPSYFRWMASIYVPLVTLALFVPICKQIGVEVGELERIRGLGKGKKFSWNKAGILVDAFGNAVNAGSLIYQIALQIAGPKP